MNKKKCMTKQDVFDEMLSCKYFDGSCLQYFLENVNMVNISYGDSFKPFYRHDFIFYSYNDLIEHFPVITGINVRTKKGRESIRFTIVFDQEVSAHYEFYRTSSFEQIHLWWEKKNDEGSIVSLPKEIPEQTFESLNDEFKKEIIRNIDFYQKGYLNDDCFLIG